MLFRLVGKLIAALGESADRARVGALAAPVADWRGGDVIEFVERLRTSEDDDYMGLGAAPCAAGTSHFLIDMAARCTTLREALVMGVRLMGVATKAVGFSLIEQGDQAVIEIREAPSARDPEHALADWSMISWHKLSQWLIGAEVWLDRTEFDHALDASYSGYATMFGNACVFNADACRLVFARTYLDRRSIRTAADAERLKASREGHFAKPVGLATTWKQLMRNVMRAEISAGKTPTLDDLAEEFGVSGQTLRRRLRAEGASYRGLKAEARLVVALDVLAHEGGTLSQASLAAGFAEPNALTRALKASGGMSSRELREQLNRWRERDHPPPGRA
jgi:AraC-like DNA-binding protein